MGARHSFLKRAKAHKKAKTPMQNQKTSVFANIYLHTNNFKQGYREDE